MRLWKPVVALSVLLAVGVTARIVGGRARDEATKDPAVAAEPEAGTAIPPRVKSEDELLVEGLWKRIYLEQDKRVMTKAELVLLRAIDTKADVFNGGWNGYFTNSAGDHAREAHAALLELDLPNHARILRRAMDVFPGGPDPDNTKRNAAIERLPDAAFETWAALSNEWFEASDDEFDDALVRFARANGLAHLRP